MRSPGDSRRTARHRAWKVPCWSRAGCVDQYGGIGRNAQTPLELAPRQEGATHRRRRPLSSRDPLGAGNDRGVCGPGLGGRTCLGSSTAVRSHNSHWRGALSRGWAPYPHQTPTGTSGSGGRCRRLGAKTRAPSLSAASQAPGRHTSAHRSLAKNYPGFQRSGLTSCRSAASGRLSNSIRPVRTELRVGTTSVPTCAAYVGPFSRTSVDWREPKYSSASCAL